MLVVRDLQRLHLRASFDMRDGRCFALQGPSGSGKTLLLRALADLDPAEGFIALDGQHRDKVPAPIWRRQVCYVAAEPGWWADTVGEHYSDWDQAAPLAERLGLPHHCANWEIARLSTGERQRLGLIRALLLNPRILLLDEPTSALDRRSARKVESLLAEQLAAGTSLLWVTHDDAQARRVSSRLLVIEEGRLREAQWRST